MARIIFAGSPEFVLPYLHWLQQSKHDLVAVYTQPDRPRGRGRKLQPSAVKVWAEAAGVPIEQPSSLKRPEAVTQLIAYKADIMLVVAYGLLLPQAVLDVPRVACLNLHYSLLPRWRGAAPVIRAMLAGDENSGVGLMHMTAGLDEGPLYAQTACAIDYAKTAGILTEHLTCLGVELVQQHLDSIISGDLLPQAQMTEGLCYAHKVKKDEAMLNWQRPAPQLMHQVQAFVPWPVAVTTYQSEQTLRIWRAQALPDRVDTAGLQPGTLWALADDGFDVLCTGGTVLRILEVQRAGGRRVSAADFMRSQAQYLQPQHTQFTAVDDS